MQQSLDLKEFFIAIIFCTYGVGRPAYIYLVTRFTENISCYWGRIFLMLRTQRSTFRVCKFFKIAMHRIRKKFTSYSVYL
jgi:hypothetical protein